MGRIRTPAQAAANADRARERRKRLMQDPEWRAQQQERCRVGQLNLNNSLYSGIIYLKHADLEDLLPSLSYEHIWLFNYIINKKLLMSIKVVLVTQLILLASGIIKPKTIHSI